MKQNLLTPLCLIIFSTTTLYSSATSFSHQAPNSTHQWRNPPPQPPSGDFKPNFQFLVAGILSFFAASISSAGGLGGGGLFIPILTIVAGLDLKTASTYTAFMVTGGLVPNVAGKLLVMRRSKPVIDYDIVLLSEPCMLLGVSLGVVCNRVLPEWLVTIFFTVFLQFCTFKTFKSAIFLWKKETEVGLECGGEEPLLKNEEMPWLKLGMLVLIWFSFFLLYLLRGDGNLQGILNIEACGSGYWIISSIQIPLAFIFTAWILLFLNNNAAAHQENGSETRCPLSGMLFFPLTALFVGLLGGLFGIGGGMLISPLLLQIGTDPQVTAATCSFMVFFSSIMSATQYLLLGMKQVPEVLTYAAICLIASIFGLTLAQKAIHKYGRVSLTVFIIGVGMALSVVLMTIYGGVEVWDDYTSGKSMGFKKPC